ncbi:MAG: glucosaminidase domain-containing protein [Chloroflexales bacterium]|nr:glucosaminidase domain-containing protein [Chloroflexales bacterium]
MNSRRQFLRLAASVAAIGALGRLGVAHAEGPPYTTYLPLVTTPPSPEPEPSPEPSPSPGPEPSPEPSPSPGPEPSPEPSPSPGPEPEPWPNDLGYILTNPSGTREQAISWLAARSTQYTRYDIEQIVGAYARIGNQAGMDWFLALAQCAHETGSLTSWWCARPRRNPAGIGVTGAALPGSPEVAPGQHWVWDGSVWREGVSFAAWDADAVSAHLGRLLAYALPIGAGDDYQRALIDYALSLRPLGRANRGVALTYIDLNGRWAVPGTTYGQRVLDLAARMRVG